MNRHASWSSVALLLVVVAGTAHGQVVRGVVTGQSSAAPLAGVLVTLEPVVDSARAHLEPVALASASGLTGLTSQRGEFAIRAPSAGTYRLSAKRIGVQRFLSESFALAGGETRFMEIVLEPALQRLPEVRVAAPAICVAREEQVSQVAALWDEASTALTANRISLRDRLFQGNVTRYVRELDPRSRRVLSEARSETRGIMDRPLTGLGGDSLSKIGYWQPTGDGRTIVYHAPDAEVLLSAAFRRDHCFSLAGPSRNRRGLVGIAFTPLPERTTGEVAGTLWLDAKSFELRLVEFRYVGGGDLGDAAGGELHFERLTNGAWVLRHWLVRMPHARGHAASPVGVDGRLPSVLVRPSDPRLVEEGAVLTPQPVRDPGLPGARPDTMSRRSSLTPILGPSSPFHRAERREIE